MRPQEIVHLASNRDGVTIEIGIVRPAVPTGSRVPVIVNASPYLHAMSTLNLRECRPELVENFVPQGYAVALVAVRGSGDSGGCMDLFGPAERADLDQAVTWLGTQPWSSGAVGMIGKSYEGGTPWEVASYGNPHLRTIVPVSGVVDVFSLLFGGGATDVRAPGVLNGIYYAESIGSYLPGRQPRHTLEVITCPTYVAGMAAAAFSTRTRQPDPLGYWAARRYEEAIEARYRGSVLLVHGLQDWNVNPGQAYPWIGRLEAQGVYVKHVLGQWGHAYPDEAFGNSNRPDWSDMLLAWFDRWLRGEHVDTGPRVEVQDARGRWRAETAWPPAGENLTFWLAPKNRLAREAPAQRGSAIVALDPTHLSIALGDVGVPELDVVCAQPLCSSYASARLGAPMRVAGRPEVELTVRPAGPEGQVSAWLYAEDDRGRARIGWGQVDLRFPNDDEERHNVRPGEPLRVRIALEPLDAVVPAGGRLVLAISEGTAHNRLPGVQIPVVVDGGTLRLIAR
jgi:putative CocE/NonD family hydrolase